MSPLSALSMPTAPDLRSLTSLVNAKGGPGPIPQADLKALTSQITGQLGSIPAPGADGLTPPPAQSPVGPMETGGGAFSNVLGRFVNEVNSAQAVAGQSVNGLLSGGNVSLHQAMIAMEEANVSFQLMIEVRNKLLESYQELMRMQV